MVPAGHWGYFKGFCEPPVTQDLDKPTNAEQEEAQQWECKDEITQCLLSQHLPDKISMDMDAYPTVKEQYISKKQLYLLAFYVSYMCLM